MRRPLEWESRRGAFRKIAFIWTVSLLLVIPAGYMVIRYDPEKIGSHLKCSWVSCDGWYGSFQYNFLVLLFMSFLSVVLNRATHSWEVSQRTLWFSAYNWQSSW